MVATSDGADEADPCLECVALLRLATLRNALRRPIPDDKNLKYTPKECLGTILSKLYAGHLGLREIMESPVCAFPLSAIAYRAHTGQDDPCVVYTKGVLSGKYQNTMFPGMIAAFVTLEGKKERGVGKQNFQYAPGFKEFLLILRSHSLHAYEFVAKHIPMVEDRSILCVVNPTMADISLIYIKGGSMSSAPHGFLRSSAPGPST